MQLRQTGQAFEEATGMKRSITQRLVESAKSLHAASLELAALKGTRSNKVWAAVRWGLLACSLHTEPAAALLSCGDGCSQPCVRAGSGAAWAAADVCDQCTV